MAPHINQILKVDIKFGLFFSFKHYTNHEPLWHILWRPGDIFSCLKLPLVKCSLLICFVAAVRGAARLCNILALMLTDLEYLDKQVCYGLQSPYLCQFLFFFTNAKGQYIQLWCDGDNRERNREEGELCNIL